MNIIKCNKEWMKAMIQMPSSSIQQNKSLAQNLEEGLPLENCYIAIKNKRCVCRIVVFPQMKYLGYFTIEDISQDETDQFMKTVLSHLDTTINWRIDLYGDKKNYQKIYTTLRKYFQTEIKRESYTVTCHLQESDDHLFHKADKLQKEEIISIIQRVNETTYDRLILKGHRQDDAKQLYEEMRQEKDLFQVLVIKEKPIGFVCVNRLLEDIGGIYYIGVDPVYQGHHYGELLLKKAIHMAYLAQIHTLIADIDEHNSYIRKHLESCGFMLDCKESVFLLHENEQNG